jgi:hypothetical protein
METPFDLHVLGTPPAFVLSQDQTLHKIIMKNLDGSLKNLFVLVQLALPNCFVLKRVPHIWLILTLLTLFSFQGTQNH